MATSDTPLKVTETAKRMVRYGAAVFEVTQGEFVERAVAEYLDRHDAEVGRLAAEVRREAKKRRTSSQRKAASRTPSVENG